MEPVTTIAEVVAEKVIEASTAAQEAAREQVAEVTKHVKELNKVKEQVLGDKTMKEILNPTSKDIGPYHKLLSSIEAVKSDPESYQRGRMCKRQQR